MRADIDQHAAFVSSDFFVEKEDHVNKAHQSHLVFGGPTGAA